MGLISRLGRWLDVRFPEKVSAESVYGKISELSSVKVECEKIVFDLSTIKKVLSEQEFKIRELQDEMNKAKVVIAMTQQMRQSPVIKSGEPWKR